MPERRRSTPVALVTVALVLMLCGCDPVGPLGGPDATTAPDPGSTATMPTDVPSWLLECGTEPKDEGETLQLADLDLTTATWATPSGFAVVTTYVEDNPVETVHATWYAEPTDPPMATLNVANVVVYTGLDWGDLADECGRVPLDAVEDKLAEYREEIGASPLTEARMTEVAGHPAIQQDIGLDRYSYTGYWLFSQTQLLHIYCQWTEEANRPTLERGCDEIVASVSVG